MNYLLDTNVVSELRKSEQRADPNVRAWAQARLTSQLFLSVITVMEVEIGVARIERREATRARALRRWFEQNLLIAFAGRVLAVDLEVARAAAGMHVPDPRPERDVLIAATAKVRSLAVVTRNISDFRSLEVEVVDPWNPQPRE